MPPLTGTNSEPLAATTTANTNPTSPVINNLPGHPTPKLSVGAHEGKKALALRTTPPTEVNGRPAPPSTRSSRFSVRVDDLL
ncbi:hypothetical protein A176_004861 [Myxococcus hansupus]|uniref:Uncharacterized protein n=1 Tax=Pseudomyxococcus hansupus TaxID=1297742 RepID=A0A0H4WYR0_9BACT|nr:hypothetical protein A176_004861 [Myxococcus hansupus]